MKTDRITLLRRPWRMPSPTPEDSRSAALERKTRCANEHSPQPSRSHAQLACAFPRKYLERLPL